MAHAFIVARLLPTRSASWTSPFGIQKAAVLVTRPFLALRVFATDLGLGDPTNPRRYTVLFVVSPEKPTGLNRDCYFTVAPTASKQERTLVVRPPFPLEPGRTLYVHTFPKLHEEEATMRSTTIDAPDDITVAPHRLDEESFRTFCRSVMEDHSRRMRLLRLDTVQRHFPGGADLVEDGWDTWSGQSDKEYLNERPDYVYEHLQFRDPPLEAPPSIHEEQLLYKQLCADYSWVGVTSAISWVQKLRNFLQQVVMRCVPQTQPDHTYTGDLPKLSLDSAVALHSMPIPFDGDPPLVVDGPEEAKEWDWDDPGPSFISTPRPTSAVPAVNVKILAFDLFGTIFDRETAMQEAVLSLTQSHHDHTPRELLGLYIECEALGNARQPGARYTAIARDALQDVASRLGVRTSEPALAEALKLLLRPRLFSGSLQAIKSLRARGYTVLWYSSLDAPTFTEHYERFVPPEITAVLPSPTSTPMHSQHPLLFPEILEYSRSIHADIQPAQILIITAAPYRVIEPANTARFPTALFRPKQGMESQVSLGTATPTLIFDDLSDLCVKLESSSPRPRSRAVSDDPPTLTMQQFRVCSVYQATKALGLGSFGSVYSAFHVLTGEEVAIKVEMPTGEPTEVCVLPYEAQVYRQLHGHPGIPLLHWSGMDGGAHVIVLDKLGPTLQQLRRVCRGQLSLKSVLMAAEQMLTRVEFVHSRGIILRDIKPENFAMGTGDRSNIIHLFDFGLAKLFVNPGSKEHIPFREGRVGLGTPRYASHNVHFGREQSRRDDIEALGNVLLFLLHGRLPWQGIYAPSIEAKLSRIGEMKAGVAFQDLLVRSPPEFTKYFDHCRNLAFEEKPNYLGLKQIFRQRMADEGWAFDGVFDWVDGKPLEKGTLLLDEYKINRRFVDVDFDW